MEKTISSVANPLIKQVALLKEKSRARKKAGLFVIEGLRELELAVKGNYVIETLLYCSELINKNALPIKATPSECIEISLAVYQKLAHRETTEGVLAMAKVKNHSLGTLQFEGKNPLILVAEAPEKPGNIGALLRTADAAALDAVIIANPKTDIYNPNIIRSSVGCVFTVPVFTGNTDEVIATLKKQEIAIYCAALSASKDYTKINYRKASAIVVGTEATGLSETWLAQADDNIIIPMHGEIDSMNVSVSAAILIFESLRQRKKSG